MSYRPSPPLRRVPASLAGGWKPSASSAARIGSTIAMIRRTIGGAVKQFWSRALLPVGRCREPRVSSQKTRKLRVPVAHNREPGA